MSRRRDQENSLYKELTQATDDIEREIIRTKLYNKLVDHAKAVLWIKFSDNPDPDLANEAAEAVILAIPDFDGRSDFSTYAHGIIERNTYTWMRKYIRRKFDVSIDQEAKSDSSDETESGAPIPLNETSPLPKLLAQIQIEQIKEHLSDEEKVFLQMLLDGSPSPEIGQRFGLSPGGVRTRTARLKKTIKEKFGSVRT